MPRHDRQLKARVRARMRRTGERYTVARAALLSAPPEVDPLVATLAIDESIWCGWMS